MNRARIALAFVFVVVLTIFAMISGSANAQNTRYWDSDGATPGGSGGTTANGTWGTSAFWSADPAGAAATAVWVNGDIAVFSASNDVTGASTIDVASDPVAGGVTVEEGTIILSGNGLVTNAGPIRINSGAVLQDASTLSLVTTAGSIMTLDGGTFRNTVAGAGSTFLDADTRTELTSLGGTFDVPTAGNVAYSNAIALSAGTTAASFTKTGVGDFRTQTSTNAYTKLVVNGGMYRPGNALAANLDENTLTTGAFGAAPTSFLADAITLNNGSFIGNVNNITLHNNRGITLGAGGGKLSVDNGNMTVPGAISGAGDLTVGRFGTTGSAVITLSSTSNSYGGATNISDGTLRLGAAGVIPNGSNVNITGTGILDLNGNNETVATVMVNSASARITGAGVLTGSSYDVRASNTTGGQGIASNLGGTASLNKTTAGTALLTAVNSYTGQTTISQGVLSVDADATLGDGTGTVNLSGGTLNTTATRSTTTDPIANPINVTASSAITTTSTAATAQVNFTSNSVSGSAGTLTFRNDGADAATDVFEPRFSGSGFDLSRPVNLAAGALGSIVRLNSFNGTGTTQTFSGDISGTGAYVRNASTPTGGGETIFTGNNTYSGGTNVSRGTLTVNNTAGSGTGSGQVDVGADGILRGTGTVGGNVVVNGGTVAGTLTLNGNLTFDATNGGTFAPGNSPGTVTMSGGGAVVFSGASNLNYELNGGDTTVGSGINDLLTGVGNLTLAGTLNVTDTVPGSFASAPAGSSWRLVNYTGTLISNSLVLGSMPAIDPGLTYSIDTSNMGQVNLLLSAVPEASSFLAVGLVGMATAAVLRMRKKHGQIA